MEKGDHLISPRVGYQHHGLYIGDDMVIHYSGLSSSLDKGAVEMTSLEEFTQGKGCKVHNHKSCLYDAEKRVERAFSKLGENSYNIIWNNCEHFVNWCFNGIKYSEQVNSVVAATAVVSEKLNGKIVENLVLEELAKSTTKKVAEDVLVKSAVTTSAASSAASSAISAAVGTTAGVATASAITGASAAAIGTAASVAAAGTLATVAAPLVVAAGVGYGVKKVCDWLFD